MYFYACSVYRGLDDKYQSHLSKKRKVINQVSILSNGPDKRERAKGNEHVGMRHAIGFNWS